MFLCTEIKRRPYLQFDDTVSAWHRSNLSADARSINHSDHARAPSLSKNTAAPPTHTSICYSDLAISETEVSTIKSEHPLG